jgi:hypothetical protein
MWATAIRALAPLTRPVKSDVVSAAAPPFKMFSSVDHVLALSYDWFDH